MLPRNLRTPYANLIVFEFSLETLAFDESAIAKGKKASSASSIGMPAPQAKTKSPARRGSAPEVTRSRNSIGSIASQSRKNDLEEPTISNNVQDKKRLSLKRQREEPIEEPKRKAHYPHVDFKRKATRSSKVESKLTHKEILCDLVKDICEAEAQGLEEYFAAELPDSSHTYILSHLREILKDLPAAVERECPDEVTFLPEVSKAERIKLEKQMELMEKLNEQVEKLEYYSNNIDEFCKEYDINQKKPSSSRSRRSVVKSDSETNLVSIYANVIMQNYLFSMYFPNFQQTTKFATEFESKLNSMNSLIDAIVSGTEYSSRIAAEARESQQRLFDGHQQVSYLFKFIPLLSFNSLRRYVSTV